MNPLLPAALAGAGVAVAIGLPLPARRAVLAPGRRRITLPAGALPYLVGVVLLLQLGPVGALVGAVLAFVGQRAWEQRKVVAARTAERTSAAEAMAVLAAELRAGRVPSDAFSAAAEVALGPTARALGAAAAATRFGAGPEEGLLRHADACAVPEMVRGLAACWLVCAGTGSSLATAVDRLEEGLRHAARQRELIDTEVAQARATAVLMACLPLFGLGLAFVVGVNPLQILFHTPVGVCALVLGVALDLFGVWWTRKLVASAVGDS